MGQRAGQKVFGAFRRPFGDFGTGIRSCRRHCKEPLPWWLVMLFGSCFTPEHAFAIICTA